MQFSKLHFHFDDKTYESRIRYVLEFLGNHPLAPAEISILTEGLPPSNAIQIVYGNPAKSKTAFCIPAQQIAFHKTIPSFSTLQANQYNFEDFKLYSVEQKSKTPRPFIKDKTFGFDLLEMIFFHISRYEEYHCTAQQLDEWDMMKTTAQFLSRHKRHRQPVVDHLVYCFYKSLGLTPKKRRTTYQMSHDIDSIEKFPSFYKSLRASARLLKDGRPIKDQFKLWQLFKAVKQGAVKDPFNTFDWLLQGDEQSWSKKVIYFGAGGQTKYDHFYNLNHPQLATIFAAAKEKGYEIGLHPSYGTWTDEAMWREEHQRLSEVVGAEVKNTRQHFLHFSFQQTPQIIETQGLAFDSTLGYQEIIGFRCGTGFSYALYDFEAERAYRFIEEPLVIMDCGLLKEVGNNLDQFKSELDHFLAENKFLTQITFNFHNSTFDPIRLNRQKFVNIYQQLSGRK